MESFCQHCGSLLSTKKSLTRVCQDRGETYKREICLTNIQSHYRCSLNNLLRVLSLKIFKKKKKEWQMCFGKASNSKYLKRYGPCKIYLTVPLWHKSRLCAPVYMYFKCGSSFLPCQPLDSELLNSSLILSFIHSFIQPIFVWYLGNAKL